MQFCTKQLGKHQIFLLLSNICDEFSMFCVEYMFCTKNSIVAKLKLYLRHIDDNVITHFAVA